MTEFKKIAILLIKTISTLVLIALLLDLFFTNVILRNLNESSNYKKISRLIENVSEDEIPIFGSSIARRNYYPDSLGFESYNYGMALSLYYSIEPLIKIELEKNKRVPIIIDFDQHTFYYNPNIPIQLSNYIPFIHNSYINEFLRNFKYSEKYQNIIGMRYFSLYTDYIRDFFKPRFEKEEKINKGGDFYPYNREIYEQLLNKRIVMIGDRVNLRKQKEDARSFQKVDQWRLDQLNALLGFHPDSTQVANFKNLLESFPQNQFILVYSPQHPAKLKGLDEYEEVISFLESFEEYRNVTVLDYSKKEFPDEYYHDPGHMNINGAKAFSVMLREDLKKILTQ